ncbi:MAG: guanylate kinase [Clostridia bacterium]|nr:guanylate kinase [Clostridia bacterium]
MRGTVVIIAGLSGGGKTTVADRLCASDTGYRMSRSHTTRPPRGDGRDDEYIYVTQEELSRLAECGELVEHTTYAGTSYGTSRTELYSIIDEGKIPVLVLDINGIRSIKRLGLFSTVCAVYLYNSLKTVDERLFARVMSGGVTENAKRTYQMRTKANISDCLDMKNRVQSIDAFIKNDDIELCVDEVKRWIAICEEGGCQSASEKEAVGEYLYREAESFTPRKI